MSELRHLIPEPEKTGYSWASPQVTLSADLDGGRSNFGVFKKNGIYTLNLQWNLNAEYYEYFRAFYNTATKKASLPFTLDLYIEDPWTLTRHLCKFVPNSMSLDSQQGESFYVSATVEADVRAIPQPPGPPPPVTTVTAKSVIFDIADNWGNVTNMGVRSIEFKNNGVVLPLVANFDSYQTTYFVPLNLTAERAFNINYSKTGDITNEWYTNLATTNQRLIVVFDEEQSFDEIVVNNFHTNGSPSDVGVRNVKITYSDQEITDETYDAPVGGGVVLNDTEWRQHINGDVADDFTVWTFS